MKCGLKVGSKIRFTQYTWEDKEQTKGTRRQRGTVTALYPHIFQCEMSDGHKECFRYNQLLGKEPDRIYLEG